MIANGKKNEGGHRMAWGCMAHGMAPALPLLGCRPTSCASLPPNLQPNPFLRAIAIAIAISRGALSSLSPSSRTWDFIPKRCILSGPSPFTGFSTSFTHVFFVQACTSRVSFRTVLGLHLLPRRVSPDDAWRSRWFELPISVFEISVMFWALSALA